MSNGSMTIGTARRSPIQRTPVIHLLVPGSGYGWVLWCGSSRGVEDSPHGTRYCRRCRALASEAASDGMYSASELGPFAPDGYTDEEGE